MLVADGRGAFVDEEVEATARFFDKTESLRLGE